MTKQCTYICDLCEYASLVEMNTVGIYIWTNTFPYKQDSSNHMRYHVCSNCIPTKVLTVSGDDLVVMTDGQSAFRRLWKKFREKPAATK